jgi:pteridine reductase
MCGDCGRKRRRGEEALRILLSAQRKTGCKAGRKAEQDMEQQQERLMQMNEQRVVLITGGARRVGRALPGCCMRGVRLVLHYRGSQADAEALAAELNAQRAASVVLLQADLLDMQAVRQLAAQAIAAFGRLDGLVNNASSFFPPKSAHIDEQPGTT